MPLYEYRCEECGRFQDHVLPMEHRNAPIPCWCPPPHLNDSPCAWAMRVVSTAVQLNPPTGAALRSHFGLFQEANQEIDHAYAKVEADVEHPVASPNLWAHAKAKASAMIQAGEAPTPRPFE